MSEIVVVGSLNIDLVASVEQAPKAGETVSGEGFAMHHGGKGANQALAASRLGAEVALIGCVGEDSSGRDLLNGLSGGGVDVSTVESIEDATTGTALIVVEASGENRIVVVPGANAFCSPALLDERTECFEEAKLALFQLETPLRTVEAGVTLAREKGCITILDPAPARELPDSVYCQLDYLTPNLGELGSLTGRKLAEDASVEVIERAARELLRRGVGSVVVKVGSRGAVRVDSSGSTLFPAGEVEVVDSTAAGDCFNGAFASALARGDSVTRAIGFACSAATVSVTRAGAQSSLPKLDEVVHF